MKMSYVVYLCLVSCASMRADEPSMPREVQELAEALQQKKEVASVTIDNLQVGAQLWPSCSFCNRMKDEVFKHDPIVQAWYTAFSDCRCSEHHELIRSAEWLAAPAVGGLAGWMGGNYCADRCGIARKLLSFPCALFAALQVSTLNTRLYRWLGDFLDRRADAAAAHSCADTAAVERVIAYLQTTTKEGESRTEAEQEYQLFCINAYDGAQSNLCSFITVHFQFPVPWLPSGNEVTDKLYKRIAYLASFLQRGETV